MDIKELIEHMNSRFVSENSVPVTSVRLTRQEWNEIRKVLESHAKTI